MMQVGSASGVQGQQGPGSSHPLGGPPGQMWKQALAEAGGEGGGWIPPGQRKKMQREQDMQAQPPQAGMMGAPMPGAPMSGAPMPGQPPIGGGAGNIFQAAPQLA